jgi:hypothetical protein
MPVIINGTTGIDTVQDGIVTDAKLNLTANSQEIKDALNAGGTAPIYACRAWVNFNGTGTVAIRASGNVSSITDNGTGDYTVNFTNALPDANYSYALSGQSPQTLGEFYTGVKHDQAPTTTTIRVLSFTNSTVTARDAQAYCVEIFR